MDVDLASATGYVSRLAPTAMVRAEHDRVNDGGVISGVRTRFALHGSRQVKLEAWRHAWRAFEAAS